MSIEAINIIDQLSREKGIDRNVLIDVLKSAVEAAARKRLPFAKNIQSHFSETTGDIEIFSEKIVVDTVENPDQEISIEETSKIVPEAELGETVLVPQALENYGRIAAQLAKQVILQKVREAEIELVYNEFKDKKDELVNGIVHRFEHGDIYIDIGKAEGILPRREQVFRETFNRGERIRAYVLDVRKTGKSAMVVLSRTHVGLIKRLFEMEVPEISEGMVEIMGIVREPNGRSKIAVKTNDRDIDAVGACVGMRGMRVQSIVQELRGEKIDIVEYSPDPETFVKNALSPAKISRIIKNQAENHMTVIVADDQMSLAIGKKGQNVKLAAKLVKWKIDIKGESESRSLLTPQTLFKTKKDFIGVLKTEGVDETLVSRLVENNIKTSDGAIEQGVAGLTTLLGAEVEVVEKILNLAQTFSAAQQNKDAVAESSETDAQKEAKPEDQEYSLSELKGIDKKIVGILSENGFETLAELSITPLEDIIAIEGIDEITARDIIEQARQHTERLENA